MKEILLTILLGIVQGLTEFLPVSSSGHLALLSDIFGTSANALFTTVALHFGTLCAVIVFYFKDLCALLKKENHKTIWLLIVATLPAGIFMLLFNGVVDKLFSSPSFVCFGFLLTAIILLVAEKIGKKIKKPNNIGFKGAIIMGTAQAVAIFPGISRSGSTIAAGIGFVKGERKIVANFSFFMSIPIILGSTLFEAVTVDYSNINITATLLGVLAAFITGYLAIKFMLKIISRCNFKWFSLYLFILFLITFTNGFIVPIW